MGKKAEKRLIVNMYKSICGGVYLTYIDGVIRDILVLNDSDIITWEALSQEITFYEEEINLKYFIKRT